MPLNGSEISPQMDLFQLEPLTTEVSSISGQTISPALTNAISSQGSEAGLTRSDSQVGPTTEKRGRDHVHVNRFQSPDSGAVISTNDISGPLFTASSPSAALQRFLVSKLQAEMDVNGSPEYVLTWKHWDMQSGPPICALRVLGRRTSGKEFSGWPTPEARAFRDLSNNGEAYAAQRARHQPSPVTAAYLRGYTTAQIPILLSRLMGFGDLWNKCAPMATRSSRKSPRSS